MDIYLRCPQQPCDCIGWWPAGGCLGRRLGTRPRKNEDAEHVAPPHTRDLIARHQRQTISTMQSFATIDHMASSAHDPFELSQVSSSVCADDTLQFLEAHGFFYLEDAEIGRRVDELYNKKLIRTEVASLDYFMPTLENNPVGEARNAFLYRYLPLQRLKPILESYSIRQPKIRFPWGTVSEVYYNWIPKSDPKAKKKLIVYMLGPGSQYVCLDGSLVIDSDGEPDGQGFYRYPPTVSENYVRKEIIMKQGGV